MRYLRWLLFFIPIAIVVELLHGNEVLLFAASALAVIPLAGLMGEATEALAEKTGPRLGGLLNATLGGKIATFDFAGGTVVHITSGVSALVFALYIGK